MVKFTIDATFPEDVIQALRAHLAKKQDECKARQPAVTGIKKSAGLAGEIAGLETAIFLLDHLEITGELADLFSSSPGTLPQIDRGDESMVREVASMNRRECEYGIVPAERKLNAVIDAARELAAHLDLVMLDREDAA